MARFATNGARFRLAGVSILLAAAALAGQERPTSPRSVAAAPQQPDQPQPSSQPYGRTPDSILPYRDFREPYKRYFQERMQFLGAGRDEEPATLPDTARIGFLGPLGSAPDADLGEHMLDGVRLAVEEANAAGGCNGIPFEIVVRRDTAQWGASASELVAFKYENHVWAVIGSIQAANTHIALRVMLKTQMLLVNTGDTDPTLTETNIPWLMRCMADDRQQGYALAHHVFQECGIERVVALRVNDHFGRVGVTQFSNAARRLKRPLLAELRWWPGDRDFTVQLDRIAEYSPQGIVLWGNAADCAAAVKEIFRRKMPVRIFGCDRLVSSAFLEAAGEAAEGVVAAATYDPTRDDPRLKAFTQAFRQRFGHPPETFAAHAYDGTNMLIAAIRKVGLNRARIRDALYEVTRYDGVTGPIVLDATLNDIGPVYIATVKAGKFIYREANFTSQRQPGETRPGTAVPRAAAPVAPYRTLAQSPPAARSPERRSTEPTGLLRIGCFLPLDDAGQAAVRGMRMALDEDTERNIGKPTIELVVRDARGAWGGNTASLVDLVCDQQVLAVIGSTERRGTHLIETLAAKLHFPVLTLCDSDPTITQIPLAWVFSLAPVIRTATVSERPLAGTVDPLFARKYAERFGEAQDSAAALGYDAVALVALRIRSGADTRLALREKLRAGHWFQGASGTLRFDGLGNRIEGSPGVVEGAAGRVVRAGGLPPTAAKTRSPGDGPKSP